MGKVKDKLDKGILNFLYWEQGFHHQFSQQEPNSLKDKILRRCKLLRIACFLYEQFMHETKLGQWILRKLERCADCGTKDSEYVELTKSNICRECLAYKAISH